MLRFAPWVVLFSIVLTLVSTHFAIRLYSNLRTDFEELLPTQARSVQDLVQIENRMESSSSLAILIYSDHPEQSKRFVTDLATGLEKLHSKLITRVEYRIDAEIRFFKRRKALMVDLGDLKKIRKYIWDRMDYEREIRNPLNIVNGYALRAPVLNIASLTSKYAGKVKEYSRFKDGFYAMDGGRVRAVLVHVAGTALGVTNALALRAQVDRTIEGLKPESYSSDLKIRFTGDLQNLIEERNSLVADLKLSTALVAMLVTLVLLIYFRNVLATLALIISLFSGTLWTFGVSYFVTGYLNANSAFLGSIVLGNGINFGIILLARYLEELRRLPHELALPLSMKGAFSGTLTAALAAGLSYGSLSLTSFRGFRQFGLIGLIGMVLCWIASFTLLPALLTLLNQWFPDKSRRVLRVVKEVPEDRKGFAQAASWVVAHAPRTVLFSGAVLTAVMGVFAAKHQGPILETDTSELRDRRSLEEGSGYYSKDLDRMFGRYLSPLVILPRSRKHTREISSRLKQIRRSQGKPSLIAGVFSIDDFIPPQQRQKIKILREIDKILTPEIKKELSGKDRRLVREFLTPEAFRPFGIRDLPPLIRARFREKDGSVGKPVLVEPVFQRKIMRRFENQRKLIGEVRGAADSVEPGAPVVGQLPLTVDMIGSITEEGPRATVFAFASVVILAVFLFRNLMTIFQALFTLLLGVVWMFSAILALDLKVNFLNFIAIPITFGIGMDYGVNILSRTKREGTLRIFHILSTTGGAVSLASLTTIIGYGSLLLAGNQGFVSFGRLAILGEITCLTAAIFMLPAMIHEIDLIREKWGGRESSAPPIKERKARS